MFFFWPLHMNATVADAYTSVSVSYPGPGSPQALPQLSPIQYGTGYFGFPDLATAAAAFPLGTYTFQGVNGPTTDTASVSYPADDFAQSIPYLTEADYSSLQGMDSARDITLHFSPFVTGSNATVSTIGFAIGGAAGLVYEPSVSLTTTSTVIPANTLRADDTYYCELLFVNFNVPSDTGSTELVPQISFTADTFGQFTTAAVPEPRSYAAQLVAAGLAGFLGLKRRRKREQCGSGVR